MPIEFSFPLVILVILVIVGIAWFVGAHADVPPNNQDEPD